METECIECKTATVWMGAPFGKAGMAFCTGISIYETWYIQPCTEFLDHLFAPPQSQHFIIRKGSLVTVRTVRYEPIALLSRTFKNFNREIARRVWQSKSVIGNWKVAISE